MPTQIIKFSLTLAVHRDRLMNEDELRALLKPNVEEHVLDINKHWGAGRITSARADRL